MNKNLFYGILFCIVSFFATIFCLNYLFPRNSRPSEYPVKFAEEAQTYYMFSNIDSYDKDLEINLFYYSQVNQYARYLNKDCPKRFSMDASSQLNTIWMFISSGDVITYEEYDEIAKYNRELMKRIEKYKNANELGGKKAEIKEELLKKHKEQLK